MQSSRQNPKPNLARVSQPNSGNTSLEETSPFAIQRQEIGKSGSWIVVLDDMRIARPDNLEDGISSDKLIVLTNPLWLEMDFTNRRETMYRRGIGRAITIAWLDFKRPICNKLRSLKENIKTRYIITNCYYEKQAQTQWATRRPNAL